ncbi:MAG: pyruvoyl-dependent arginine decarboxylase [Candidatus Aenigmarchaeota archaeon]|nr:pyruvoyl-dependent arginine decarboxylase [Candidatus Aenigmarchaeota archaeon]
MNIGNRIPKDFFITSGVGQSDITIHAGSYHLALKDAGIESFNIMTYSSILPGIAQEVPKPSDYVHGSVMETIMACSNAEKGQLATVGIIFGWLYDKNTGEKYGGLVCEYNGHDSEEFAIESLKASLNELYNNGFDDKYDLNDIKVISRSFVPEKRFGTALVSLCFTNYVYPVVD